MPKRHVIQLPWAYQTLNCPRSLSLITGDLYWDTHPRLQRGCLCWGHILPRALQPPQSPVTLTPRSPGSSHTSTSERRILRDGQWAAGSIRTPSPSLSVLTPCAPGETQPACVLWTLSQEDSDLVSSCSLFFMCME